MRGMTDKEILALGAGIISLDIMFNDGKFSKYIAEKVIEKMSASKIVYVPVTEKELVDCSFGC